MINAKIDANANPPGGCTLDGTGQQIIQEFYNLNIMLIKSIVRPVPLPFRKQMLKEVIQKAMVDAYRDACKQIFCGGAEDDIVHEEVAE